MLLGFVGSGFAGMDHTGTSMANFLKIGVGGKAVGMGDAFTAIADDPTALYWNPGGIGFQHNLSANFSYTDWIFETNLSYLGVIIPAGEGTFGLSIYSFSSGDIEETTIYKPHGTGRVFSASDILIGASYGRKLNERFSVGLTFKYIKEDLSLESASTFAIDIGSIFILSYDYNVRMGLSITNFGADMQLSGLDLQTTVSTENAGQVEATLKTVPWPLPLGFRVGLASDIISNETHKLTVAMDVYDPRDYKIRESLGMEYSFKSMFFIRGGYKFNYDEETFSAGLGFHYPITGLGKVMIDYSYSDMGRLQQINRFSIGLSF
jgi:hypothetical protein